MQEIIKKALSKSIDIVGKHSSRIYPSQNIFEKEWDVMLILDACRYDLMNEVAPEFDYLPEIGKSYSLATKTPVWMERTFSEAVNEELAETAYITGNPNSAEFVDPSKMALVDEVWKYAWNNELGTITMEPITDRAISVGRTQNFSRLLVHYMQPHEPFLSSPELGGSDTVERKTGQGSYDEFQSVWSRLENGEIAKEIVWKHYRENLRKVLRNIEILVNNVEADKLVITSDHGNALGEWNQYGHPAYRPIPSIIQVPWIELSSTDSGMYEPDNWEGPELGNVESRLRDLGYI
ncbi:hypothetical protein SAMN04488065_1550 [Haloplanus vescus]|uniref:Sulfatase n=1 Tax=Haloplanus vescus TaxID=555874 RepID=A0A1H3XGA6_9EURY|nr:hypothetical protein [Haloplanus vescus]SDZ98389.1 hypothetical protein SAMN04488065_1550 [Haloplanus vescus]